MNTGEKIRYRRKLLKITQKQLAETADISISSLNKIERGHFNNFRQDFLEKIARVLNTSARALQGDVEI